jgi:NADH-quinone oxidoreductase subunit N
MASARDLISIFVALELLSIPAYMLAAWRKRDRKSNEAGLKYYLMGVFASAVLLYGMSLLYGWSGSTLLSEIGEDRSPRRTSPAVDARRRVRHRRLRLQGLGRAVPHLGARHLRGRTDAGHRVLGVASKAAGFVAIIQLVFNAFPRPTDVVEPLPVGARGARR